MNISHNNIFSLFLLFALFFLQVQGHFVAKKNSITVLSPHDLRGKNNGAIGSFGISSHGGYIIGSVVSPKYSHGCQVFKGDKPFKFRSYHPTIVLLDRGECSFILKVYHAQMVGAAAVLITDIIDEPLEIMGSLEERADANGLNEKILIPSFLIQLSFANSLKTSLNNKENVLLRIDQSAHTITYLYVSPPSDLYSISPTRDNFHPNENIPPPIKPETSTPHKPLKDLETSNHRWLMVLATVVGVLAIRIIYLLFAILVRKYFPRLASAAAAINLQEVTGDIVV